MYVSPVSLVSNYGTNKKSIQLKNISPKFQTNSVDTVSFTSGNHREIQKNQYRILLTQDIWAPKLSVKMPENGLEKEALLEILEQRQKLDRYARLTNERAEIITKISYTNDLLENDPTNPELEILTTDLAKRGNLTSVLNTLNSQIELEAKKNKPAIEYFENLAKLEDEYLAKKMIKEPKMTKFWYQIQKGNINKDGQYSTRELIQIVKSGKNPTQKTAKPRVLSPKELLVTTSAEYSELLREHVNVYSLNPEQANQASVARKIVLEKYQSNIGRYSGIEKSIDERFKEVEKQFNRRVDLFSDILIRPLGELWQQMDEVKKGINITKSQIADAEAKLEADKENEQLQAELQDYKDKLEMQRFLWLEGVKRSVAAEKENRNIMIEHNRLSAYDYLTGKNPVINKHKAILELYTQNNNSIPEEKWDEILA